jgi:hypothetical protein
MRPAFGAQKSRDFLGRFQGPYHPSRLDPRKNTWKWRGLRPLYRMLQIRLAGEFREHTRIVYCVRLSLLWIRIRIGNPDPDPGGQKRTHKIEEVPWFEMLDVLFWGLKASPVAWTSFMGA